MADPSNPQEPIDLLVLKVAGIREKLETSIRDLAKSSEELRLALRKSPQTDLTSSYLAFASAHMRLASATSTEMGRTARTEVRIVRAKVDQEEEARRETLREEARKKRQAAKEAKKQATTAYNLPPVDTSFEELYGEVTDAER